MKLQPHEAWRVLPDIVHGGRVVNTAPLRPVVGTLDQAPLDFLKDWLGVSASDGNIYCDGEWRATCPFQIYGCTVSTVKHSKALQSTVKHSKAK